VDPGARARGGVVLLGQIGGPAHFEPSRNCRDPQAALDDPDCVLSGRDGFKHRHRALNHSERPALFEKSEQDLGTAFFSDHRGHVRGRCQQLQQAALCVDIEAFVFCRAAVTVIVTGTAGLGEMLLQERRVGEHPRAAMPSKRVGRAGMLDQLSDDPKGGLKLELGRRRVHENH